MVLKADTFKAVAIEGDPAERIRLNTALVDYLYDQMIFARNRSGTGVDGLQPQLDRRVGRYVVRFRQLERV